jgi:hypothetical protein
MPRAIVMLRPLRGTRDSNGDVSEPDPQQGTTKKGFEKILNELALSEAFVHDNGVIFEFYMRVFGWPDYIVSLYGPNESLLIHAVVELRRKCRESGIDATTSTYLGMCPEDPYMRAAEYKSEGLQKLFADFSVQGRENAIAALAKTVNLEEAKNYVEFHRIMLDFFNFRINTMERAKSYKSGLQSNQPLLKQLLDDVYFNEKKIRKEEKQDMLKNANL